MKDKDHEPLCPEDSVASTYFLEKIMEKYKINLNAPENLLAVQWENILGSTFSNTCSFHSLKDGVLTVLCSHSAQAAGVRMNKNEIIKKIKSVFPELDIRKINIRINK